MIHERVNDTRYRENTSDDSAQGGDELKEGRPLLREGDLDRRQVVEEEDPWELPLAFGTLEVLRDAELIGVYDIPPGGLVRSGHHLDEILIHAGVLLHKAVNAIHRVHHSGKVRPEGELVNGVRNVERDVIKGHEVMDVHVPLLEGLPWGKVKVPSHLRGMVTRPRIIECICPPLLGSCEVSIDHH
eukprot:1195284-Prorocentrum_minimum.AAC.5